MSGQYYFELYDGDGSRSSANGVYLNGNNKKIKGPCHLEENDTIQIGLTKLVFKVNKDDTSESTEVKNVMNARFMRTVQIDTQNNA